MATNDYNTSISSPLKHEGVQDQGATQKEPQVGKLSRYQVVLNNESDSGISSKGELGVYAEAKKVSIFERIINYFTGALTQEKNEAMIGFIGTGTLKVLDKDEEGNALLVDLENLTPGVEFHNQLRIFKAVMDGSTEATPDQQAKAVDALVAFIKKHDDSGIRTKAQEYMAKHGIEYTALQEALLGETSVSYDTVEAVKPLANEGLSQEVEDDEFFEIDLND